MTVSERMLEAGGRANAWPLCPGARAVLALLLATMVVILSPVAGAQAAPATTSVQGTIYRGDGSVASGTVLVSWPSFTTAANQGVTAGSLTVTIGADGWLHVNLASNAGASPAGTYYTAVFHLNDGTVNKEFWVIPVAATVAVPQVRAQLMPATVAVQTVSKQYVDSAVTALTAGLVTTSGGTLLGPLTLNSDPTGSLQAATKHYVDFATAGLLPTSGGTVTGQLTAPLLNGTSYPQASLQAAVGAAGTNGSVTIPSSYGGTDTFTNPHGVRVQDLRTDVGVSGRSVKEWGARCDGSTNDTAALQAALDYAYAHHVLLTLPSGTCMTHTLHYRGESITGMGTDKSALSGFPGAGEDVLANTDPGVDAAYQTTLQNSRLEHFAILVDQTIDSSASPSSGTRPAGSGKYNRPMEANSIFSPGACNGSGCWSSSTHHVASVQAATRGSGAAWYVGNCGIAMPNTNGRAQGFVSAKILDLSIQTIGADPDGSYQAKSTHSCGMYLQAWPYDSHFEHLAIIAATAYAVPVAGAIVGQPSSDGNTYKDLIFHSAHAFTTVVGAHNVIDQAQFYTTQSADTGEAPTGLVLDCYGTCGGWSLRNIYQEPGWYATQPQVRANVTGGTIQSITVNAPGLGWLNQATVSISDATGSGASFTAVADGYGTLTGFTQVNGGHGYSASPVVQISQQGNINPYYPLNLIDGFNMTFFAGNVGQGGGGYTVFDAMQSQSYGTSFGGGGTIPGGGVYASLLLNDGLGQAPDNSMNYTGMQNYLWGIGSTTVTDNGFSNTAVTAAGSRTTNAQPARSPANRQSSDFALLGGGTANQAFTSLDDLFFTAEDLVYNNSQALGTTITSDPTAPVTQKYATVVSPGTFSAQRVDGGLMPQNALGFQPGGNFPVRDGVLYAAVKADVVATQEWDLLGGGLQGVSFDVFGSTTLNLTQSWQTVAIPYHVIGNQGNHQPGLFVAGQPPSQATRVYVAWMAFVPTFSAIALGNDPTQSNQAATKHYVDTSAMPTTGGTLTGTLKLPNSIGKLPRVDVRHPDFGGGADPSGGQDSSAAITLAITYAITNPGNLGGATPCLYLATGNYKVHNLRIPRQLCMIGEGTDATVLQIPTDASLGGRQNLLTVTGSSPAAGPVTNCGFGQCGGYLANMTLRGSGSASTGTLLEMNSATTFHVDNVKFFDHGGRAVGQNGGSERADFRNIEIDSVRFSIDVGSVNETYWHDLHIGAPGISTGGPGGGSGTFPNNGNYFYNINCPGGVCSTSGTWLPDPHAAVYLGGAVNYHFYGFSIKPTVLQGAFKVGGSENISLNDGYCEGYVTPSINPCLTLIGKLEKTTTTAAMTSAGNIIVPEASSDWFPAYYGSPGDVPSDPAVDGFFYILYPPDYVYNDTTNASSLGGGIKRGSYECVVVSGHSTDGAHIATRGARCQSFAGSASSTTAYAWPAGSVLEISAGGFTSPVVLNNVHASSFNTGSLAPYDINGCDDTLGAGHFNGNPCAEIVVGPVPDLVIGKGPNSAQLSVGNGSSFLMLSGGTRVGGPIRVYQQGTIADYGVNNIFINAQQTTSLAATNAATMQQSPSAVSGVQAQSYGTGIQSALTLTAPANEIYSQNFGNDFQPPIANRTLPISLGGGIFAAGHQYNFQNCFIDTTATTQSNNRVCFHGFGDLSPGITYEVWNGSTWVNVWNVTTAGFSGQASMQLGSLGYGYNGCATWNSACLMQFSPAGATVPGGKVLDLGSSGTSATGTQAVNAAYVSAGLPLTGLTASVGGSALAAGACATAAVTIPGATTMMVSVASPAGGADPGDGFTVRAAVTAANTVKVKVCALVAGTPASSAYAVRVIQ